MDIKSLTADSAIIASTKEKTDRNTQWLKARKDDIFIDESVKVLSRMIDEGRLAKKD